MAKQFFKINSENKDYKVLSVFGTRPEAIKMAPIIKKISYNKIIEHKICVTGQHNKMLHDVLELFEIIPDYNLNIMSKNQSLADITNKILNKISFIIDNFVPDLILVHGDTTTTMSASLAAYYSKIPVVHIEAGLRTNNIYSPWPEEANRKLTTVLSKIHMAPTSYAEKNLITEGVNRNDIYVTGNTVIDSLFIMVNKINSSKDLKEKLNKDFSYIDYEKKLILVTGHRRENLGEGFNSICKSLINIAKDRKDCIIVYPLHLNPNVRNIVNKNLKGIDNIYLVDPVGYLEFVYLMQRAYIILTDSGGIQEEAPSLGKPVLVMRNTTERQEALVAGTIKLVGTDDCIIKNEVEKLLDDKITYEKMSKLHNPYGDGKASSKIVDIIFSYLKSKSKIYV